MEPGAITCGATARFVFSVKKGQLVASVQGAPALEPIHPQMLACMITMMVAGTLPPALDASITCEGVGGKDARVADLDTLDAHVFPKAVVGDQLDAMAEDLGFVIDVNHFTRERLAHAGTRFVIDLPRSHMIHVAPDATPGIDFDVTTIERRTVKVIRVRIAAGDASVPPMVFTQASCIMPFTITDLRAPSTGGLVRLHAYARVASQKIEEAGEVSAAMDRGFPSAVLDEFKRLVAHQDRNKLEEFSADLRGIARRLATRIPCTWPACVAAIVAACDGRRDLLARSEIGKWLTQWIHNAGWTADRLEASPEFKASMLVIPQIDQVTTMMKDVNGDDVPVYPETVIMMVQRAPGVMGTSMELNIKVGKINSADVLFAKDGDGRITPGSIQLLSKSGSWIKPMITQDGVLKPNDAFWQRNDVDMNWADVCYDSFAGCPTIEISVEEIGGTVLPGITHQDIREIRDRILDVIVGPEVSKEVPSGLGWVKDAKILKWRSTHAIAQAEMLANEMWEYKTDDGMPFPASFLDRHFPTGTPETMSEVLHKNAATDRNRYDTRIETFVIDYKKMVAITAETDIKKAMKGNRAWIFSGHATMLSRKGMDDTGVVTKISQERAKNVLEFFKQHRAGVELLADRIIGAAIYDQLMAIQRAGPFKMAGITPNQGRNIEFSELSTKVAANAKISDEMCRRWVRDAYATLNQIANRIPQGGSARIDIALATQKILEFQAMLDRLRASDITLFSAKAGVKTSLEINQLVAYEIYNGWREIYWTAVRSITDTVSGVPMNQVDPAIIELGEFADSHLGAVVYDPLFPENDPGHTFFSHQARAYVLRDVYAWEAGVYVAGQNMRYLFEAIMFPELVRIDAEGSFNLLVKGNNGWKLSWLTGPINGKYYFEVYAQDENSIIPGSRRIGCFDAWWGNYMNDPANAGVIFFVDDHNQPTMSWQDLEDCDFSPPIDTEISPGVMNFWDVVNH